MRLLCQCWPLLSKIYEPRALLQYQAQRTADGKGRSTRESLLDHDGHYSVRSRNDSPGGAIVGLTRRGSFW